jgi:alkanesulfonate monooxygenase SsuD/methylene tetrahydromethanopterin reductase-like flavin-dependent oxidoreductase (luciferase family)
MATPDSGEAVFRSIANLCSPFPLLAAVGAKISRIEIGTAIIDMRYKNSLEIVDETRAQLV